MTPEAPPKFFRFMSWPHVGQGRYVGPPLGITGVVGVSSDRCRRTRFSTSVFSQIRSSSSAESQIPAQLPHSTSAVVPTERERRVPLQRGQTAPSRIALKACGTISTPHSMQKRAPLKRRALHIGQTPESPRSSSVISASQ